MIISLIVALDEKGGIGKNNQLPWRLPSDLQRFKKLTMGHHIVMGRKTYESIGKPLAGRVMIVITRQKGYSATGCVVVHSLLKALKMAEDGHESEIFIIGGGQIFRQAIHLADKIYLTMVHADVDADIRFPKINLDQWTCLESVAESQNTRDEFQSSYKILIRRINSTVPPSGKINGSSI